MKKQYFAFRQMWQYIYPYRIKWFLGNLCDVAGLILFSISTAYALEYFINAIAWRNVSLLYQGMALLGIAILLMVIFEGAYKKLFFTATAQIKAAIQKNMFARLLERDIYALKAESPAERMVYLNRDVDISLEMVGDNLVTFFCSICMSVVSVFCIGTKNIYFGFACFLLFVMGIVVHLYFIPKQSSATKDSLGAAAKLDEVITDAVDGGITIRANGLPSVLEDIFQSRKVEFLKKKSAERNVGLWQELLGNMISKMMVIVPVMMGIWNCGKGGMTVGSVFFVFQLSMNLSGYTEDACSSFIELEKAQASVERLTEGIGPKKQRNHVSDNSQFEINEIACKNISVTYDGKAVLDKFNGSFQKGQITVLTGKSGAGKSTCIEMLMQFLPYKGELFINGKNVKTLDVFSIYSHISYVEQNPALFDGTIYENILYGSCKASEEAVKKAAILACIHEEIETMPEKYNTRIGENGAFLSGGQKQRIALARAFLKDSDVFLMDESTSAIDIETEARIMKHIQAMKENKIIIMTAHRESVMQAADRIMEIVS